MNFEERVRTIELRTYLVLGNEDEVANRELIEVGYDFVTFKSVDGAVYHIRLDAISYGAIVPPETVARNRLQWEIDRKRMKSEEVLMRKTLELHVRDSQFLKDRSREWER